MKNDMIYRKELCELTDKKGKLTKDGKILLEMALHCTFDGCEDYKLSNISWWDQLSEKEKKNILK